MTTLEPATSLPSPDATGIRWNLVVGVLGVLYATGGVIMHTLFIVWSFLAETMMKLGGMEDVVIPPVVRWSGVAQSIVLVILGLILGVGSILLVMRRPRGLALLKTWVIARVLMLVVGLTVGFVTLDAQVSMTYDITDAQYRTMKARNVPEEYLRPAVREDIERNTRYMLVGMTVVFAAFPLFVGLLVTNRKKLEQVESWRLEGR